MKKSIFAFLILLAAQTSHARNCMAPWGQTVFDGSSVLAYLESSPRHGTPCWSEYRRCTNGFLMGSYYNQFCQPSVLTEETVAPAEDESGSGNALLPIF